MAHYENLSQNLVQFDNKFLINYVFIILIFTVHRSSPGTDGEKLEAPPPACQSHLACTIMEIANIF